MSVIICAIDLTEEQAARIRSAAPGYELLYGRKNKALWRARAAEAEIVIAWDRVFAQQCLGPDTRLKWIQSWSAGVDYYPMQQLSDRGIYLTTTSGIHAYPLSESILAMMLAFTRKMHVHLLNQSEGRWERVEPSAEMHGRTAGIIGVGAIGEETARLLKAFGMRVLGLRHSGRPSPNIDHMYDDRGLDTILQQSDYVIVTLPLTEATRGMFGREQFRRMKETAMFINIGRGGLVDEEALIEALREGIIGGAGLDVFEKEPLPEDSPLWKLDNVIITPHIAGASDRYDERALDVVIENLQSYIKTGAPSRNLVDYDKQY